MNTSTTYKIAVFASGRGSNARRLIDYFEGHPAIAISAIVSNKADAQVLQLDGSALEAKLICDRQDLSSPDGLLTHLDILDIHFIILAGFLWKIPEILLSAYPDRIINIHPALLPAYGGQGMYGRHVHEAVLASGDQESGITIHLVDEHYDHGRHLLQATCDITDCTSAEDVAARVLRLEHRYLPVAVEEYITSYDGAR